jgi:hypothetical protein
LVRDNKRRRGNEENRKCWDSGNESHVRPRIQIFKRRIEKKEKKTIEIIREEDIQYLHKVWKHGECFRASNTAAYGQSVSLFYAITHV